MQKRQHLYMPKNIEKEESYFACLLFMLFKRLYAFKKRLRGTACLLFMVFMSESCLFAF